MSSWEHNQAGEPYGMHLRRVPGAKVNEPGAFEPETSLDNAGVDRRTYEQPNCGSTKPHDQHIHSPIGGLRINCPGVPELRPDQYPPWPWRELDDLSRLLYLELRAMVATIMRDAGEDPHNQALFNLRCVQVAYGINSRAEQEARA